MSTSFQRLTLQPFVVRPDVGSSGPTCRLYANHYRLGTIPDITIYQYSVEISIDGFPIERKIPPRIAREIVSSHEVQEKLGPARSTFVFDGNFPLSSHLTFSREYNGMEQIQNHGFRN
jgi:hypothetical protein